MAQKKREGLQVQEMLHMLQGFGERVEGDRDLAPSFPVYIMGSNRRRERVRDIYIGFQTSRKYGKDEPVLVLYGAGREKR